MTLRDLAEQVIEQRSLPDPPRSDDD
jgi:hypothetical protein